MATVSAKGRTRKARTADLSTEKVLHGMRPLPANRLNLILRVCDGRGATKLYTVTPDPNLCPVERGNGCWVLENLTDDRTYWIADTFEQGWVCSCLGFEKIRDKERGCKHLRAFRTARAAFWCARHPG